MKRSEIKVEYTWDLSDIFENALSWEKSFSLAEQGIKAIPRYKSKLDDEKLLLEALNKCAETELLVEWVYIYAKMNTDLDGASSISDGMLRRARSLAASLSAASSYIVPELTMMPEETLDKLIYNPDFADYDYYFKCIRRNKAHVLSAKEEMIIARYGEVLGSFHEIFEKINNVDLPVPKISDGTCKVPLTAGTYSRLLQNPDAAVRKRAFAAYYKLYENQINTIAATFSASVKSDNIEALLRGYSSALSKALASDDVPSAVYEKLVKSCEEMLPSLHRYVDYRRQKLGKLHMYDMYVPLENSDGLQMSYEEAYETVISALAPLGGDYIQLLKTAKNSRWIDVMETENKRGGAYSWGAYGSHPYVLLNYSGTPHDVFTIAHELGHAMHSHFSDNAQPQQKAGYSIFVAEVASTVNEVLTLKYLISRERNLSKKRFLLSYYLDMMRTTFFRQTMFAEFEKRVHETDFNGNALTVDSLNKMYLKLNKKYYGSGVIHDRQIKFEWCRIPHFYNAFYVYKYASGITSAITLADALLSGNADALEKYRNFLSAGGSKSPYEILKDAGVDLMTDAPYRTISSEFNKTLEELSQAD